MPVAFDRRLSTIWWMHASMFLCGNAHFSLSPFSWPRTLWGRRIYDQSPKASSQKLLQARHGLHSRTLLGKEDLRPKPKASSQKLLQARHGLHSRTLLGKEDLRPKPKASSQKLLQARHGLHSRTLLGKEDLRPKPKASSQKLQQQDTNKLEAKWPSGSSLMCISLWSAQCGPGFDPDLLTVWLGS